MAGEVRSRILIALCLALLGNASIWIGHLFQAIHGTLFSAVMVLAYLGPATLVGAFSPRWKTYLRCTATAAGVYTLAGACHAWATSPFTKENIDIRATPLLYLGVSLTVFAILVGILALPGFLLARLRETRIRP